MKLLRLMVGTMVLGLAAAWNPFLTKKDTHISDAEKATRPGGQGHKLQALARKYFEVWNEHNANSLKDLFAPGVTLRDWDVEKSGAEEVAKANGNVFAAEPNIHANIESIHVSAHTSTVICEVEVQLRNAKQKVQKVVKLLAFDDKGKITSVHAYKGPSYQSS